METTHPLCTPIYRVLSPLLIGLMIWMLYPTQLSASTEELDTLQQYVLSDLVVTGIKEQGALSQLPLSGTRIEGSELQLMQITGLKDFTGMIPNFLLMDRDTPQTTSIFVRGMGSTLNPPIAMYVDGVPHVQKNSFDISLLDVDRIDFLRGPQGTLFGRNAMGGVLLVQTRSPFKHPGTSLRLRAGMYGEADVRANHAGVVSGTDLGYSIGARYRHFGGYIPNLFTDQKADKSHSAAAILKLEWAPTDHTLLRWTNTVDYVRQGAFTYGLLEKDETYVGSVNINYPSAFTRKMYNSGLYFTWFTKHFELRNQVSFQFLDAIYAIDQDGSPEDIYGVTQRERQYMISDELSLAGNIGRYEWSFGAFGLMHLNARTADSDAFKQKKFTFLKYDEKIIGVALYHQSSLDITDRLRLEAGIRYDLERSRQHSLKQVTIADKPQPDQKDDITLPFSHFTPKVSLSYNFINDLRVYATWANGYVSGGFNPFDMTDRNPNYGAEISSSYEVGLKGWLLPHHLYAEMALFAIDTQGKQLRYTIPQKGFIIRNAGQTLSTGFEASIHALPLRGWSIDATFGSTRALFTDYKDDITGIDYTGKMVPYVPLHTLSLRSQYRIDLPTNLLADAITLSVGYKGVGPIYWLDNNSARQEYYGLLDATIRMERDRLTYSLWGTNLTGTRYLGYMYSSMGKNWGKPGRPFTAGIEVGYRF